MTLDHYLLYWKTFWEENGGRRPLRNEWWTNRAWLWNRISSGDRIWLVVKAQAERGEWCLLQRLDVLRAASERTSTKRKFGIYGNPETAVEFQLNGQPDFAHLLHQFEFSTGRRLNLSGAEIGRALQSPRRLASQDVLLLEKFAAQLQTV